MYISIYIFNRQSSLLQKTSSCAVSKKSLRDPGGEGRKEGRKDGRKEGRKEGRTTS
jgi:hypothetical protein